MAPKSDLHLDYVIELENELRKFEKKEDAVTKRMQMLVYPAMVAFFILSAYGFYLIQSLTTDIGRMTNTVEVMSNSVTKNMDSMSTTTEQMSQQMGSMVISTSSMTGIMGGLADTTKEMSSNVSTMTNSITSMQVSTGNMQKDMWSLNQNVSTPLSLFNKFIPWNNNSNGRFPGSSSPPMLNKNTPNQAYYATQTIPANSAISNSNGATN